MTGTSEFDLINDYFSQTLSRDDVLLGIGDDCALVAPSVGKQMVVTVDTLVAGVHFPENTRPADIAYKAIAVNLSDLASMGAQPAYLTLALTLPAARPDWLRPFADSFHQTCLEYDVQLIGGDTTKGPLSITIQAIGYVEAGRAMQRNRAKPDDRIYVTGTLGDAALALNMPAADKSISKAIYDSCMKKLNRPLPRVAFGIAASEYCHCAIDISDGLLADLKHITTASGCGADIYLERIPLSNVLKKYFVAREKSEAAIDWSMVLAGGDDYELCLVAPEKAEAELMQSARVNNVTLTCIGRIKQGSELTVLGSNGKSFDIGATGYKHFS